VSHNYGVFICLCAGLMLGCEEDPGQPQMADIGSGGSGGMAGVGGHGGMAGVGGHGGQGGQGGMAGIGGQGGQGGMAGIGGQGGMIFKSQKSNLRFKGPYRLQLELQRITQLPTNEICRELGAFDCVGLVHHIALGGVEAYNSNVYKPFEATAISAPMAVERIALQACSRSRERDISNFPEAVLFRAVPLSPDQLRILDIEGPEAVDHIQNLFRRILLREANTEEIASFQRLYRDIEGDADAQKPAQEWAIASCMILFSSIEFLFY
jgi:hypothetical protein